MSHRHLPAGQAMPGGGPHGVNMGARQGRSPRQHNQYHQGQPYQHQPPVNQMYTGYMGPNPYGHAYAYSPVGMHNQYQTGGMPSPQPYVPYAQPPYNRPTSVIPQQYAPPLVVGSHHHMIQPPYPGLSQAQSPIVSTPFQPPPPAPAPLMPTPALDPIPIQHPVVASSIPLPVAAPAPSASSTPPAVDHVDTVVNTVDAVEPVQQLPNPTQPDTLAVEPMKRFRAPLPWYSRPDEEFPTKKMKSRRRRKIPDTEHMSMPTTQGASANESLVSTNDVATVSSDQQENTASAATPKSSHAAPAVEPPATRSEAPSTPQDVSSEYASSTSPTTPTSVQNAQDSTTTNLTPTQPTKSTPRPVPAVPVVPVVPKANRKDARPSTAEKVEAQASKEAATPNGVVGETDSKEEVKPVPPPVKQPPKSWSDLLKAPASRPVATAVTQHNGVNGSGAATAATSGTDVVGTVGFSKSKNNSLAEALKAYRVGANGRIVFVEPRGLVNTGNMCYMNSVLQALLFCIPFYDFLYQAGQKNTHSFGGNSETPLIDAMISLFQQFKVIHTAKSLDQLRQSLKREELEQYGAQFTPEFVYEAVQKLSRFDGMQRGHQQDAEEFLGFLLQALHDECEAVMPASAESNASSELSSTVATPTSSHPPTANGANDTANGWYEVGKRQRPAVTRSSGQFQTSTPISKIFGGQLRSVVRVRGQKDSVTFEAYQPLQLDIGAPDVRNIVDALRGLTRAETLHGDFQNTQGNNVAATKQVLIDSLPPVLILHLKRFQFDPEGHGTVKIWKKVGYPLELEIPREVLAQPKRTAEAGLPRYKLTAVVYHHGKNASTGHYTVDVRRQDDQEWIRMDDTLIRRVRREDVAEGGAEEDPAKTVNNTKKDGAAGAASNRFAAVGDVEAGDSEDGWNKVNSSLNGSKKWSSVVNGSSSGTSTPKGKAPPAKDNFKDSKVAYILFYQRI